MKVTITGGAGYIGSVLCEELLHSGHEATVLDNFRHGVPSLNHLCYKTALKVVRGDVRIDSRLNACIADCDIIIPLAGIVGMGECLKDQTAAITTNYLAIKDLCNATGARVIFPNTNSGYGISGESICTEESPLQPISLYGQTKCDAEQEIVERGNYTVFRLATVFGMSPRMRWDLMVNDFVYRAVKDRAMVLFEPHFRRNFIHVRDVARAFIWALEYPDISNNQVYNLGNDDANMTKMELALKIKERTEFHPLVDNFAQDPDKRDYNVSSQKLISAGFKPIYSVEYGIDELIKGVQQFV